MDIAHKFSNNYKRALKTATQFAGELSHETVQPIHLLYGLLLQRGSVGAEIFTALDITPENIRDAITAIETPANTTKTKLAVPPLSKDTEQLIQKSARIALINDHHYIGTEHLLAALIELQDKAVMNILGAFGIEIATLTQQTICLLKSTSKLPDLTQVFKVGAGHHAPDRDSENPLDIYGIELTSKKIQQKIDPVIGREPEIERLIQILSRRNKNNPLILGEPGVGKTALVEGLAKKIIEGEVPDILLDKKIYAIDLTATIAGTMYRGEFENRIRQIIEEAKSRPEVILFIDEIHNIIGAGSATGSMDAANILKPALARGEIRCIGATTFHDYRKSIENDPALERRFQVIKISEPTTEQAQQILTGVKKYYETFHHVIISDEAITAAVTLSQKYLPEKFLPDKALDLIDESAARFKIAQGMTAQQKQIREFKKRLATAQTAKRQAIENDDFAAAVEFKKIIADISSQIDKITTRKPSKRAIPTISADDIAQVVATMTGIPAHTILASEKRRALQLEQQLKETIIGQDTAIAAIAQSIKRAKAGLGSSDKPLASLMFVGPSGSGKTYTAKMLAKLIFDDPKACVRIDMSEYGERFNVSKLIGAPAGYVGYKESGQLTEKVKHKPYCLVLFDEIDKANPDVFDLLLQVLDDGYLTDASGTRINFQQTIIVMTSNVGSHLLTPPKQLGFSHGRVAQDEQLSEKINQEIKHRFKPEFINRLDAIVHFDQLTLPSLKKIVALEIKALKERLAKKNIKAVIGNDIITHIAQSVHSAQYGARGIRHYIQDHLENPLAHTILSTSKNSTLNIRFELKNGIISIKNK